MKEKQSMDVGTCPVSASHETTACVPVSICPFAEPGEISIEHCGEPRINCGGEPCCGIVNGRFEFTISQKMKINIPIVFGADIAVGEAYIHNGQTTGSLDGECSICNCDDCDDCDDCEGRRDTETEVSVAPEIKNTKDTLNYSEFSSFLDSKEHRELEKDYK